MADIVLDKVSKQYPDGTLAISELDLAIADGEFMILVGPSGCGKSTVLSVIAGLEGITSGELRIGGQRMNEKKPRERDLAMVFQSYALYPHLTVRENMAFPLRLAKVNPGIIERKVTEAAAILELTPWLDRKPAQLSGGQQQRVAMGRAIVRRPNAFLMDEPLSNLDARLRVQMRTQISRLQRQLGTTTLYVTHDQTEAMTLGDRVVVMRAGVVQQVGNPQHLYDSPANLFVAEFIGSPSMNFVRATVEGDHLYTALGTLPINPRLRRQLESTGAPRDFILGIRPEDFEDAALVDDTARALGAEFEAPVDLVESTGWVKYAYFSLNGAFARQPDREDLLSGADQSSSGSTLVTRLSAASAVRAGTKLRVWYSLEKLHLFDPTTGRTLVRQSPGS